MGEKKLSGQHKKNVQLSPLRLQAEERLMGDSSDLKQMPLKEVKRLVHELQVHQIELELQNDELRRVQGELEESRNRLAELYDLAPVGYFTVDNARVIIECNQKAAKLLGAEKAKLIKQRVEDFFGEAELIKQHYQAVLSSGAKQSSELSLRNQDGAVVLLESEQIKKKDWAPQCWSMIMDITARKKAESALARADQRKDEFLAILSHELRNPLAPIVNAIQLIKQADRDGDMIEHGLRILENQVNQIVRLVGDLLDVSRLATGKIQLKRERHNLADVVNLAGESTRPLIESHNHQIEVQVQDDPLYIEGDSVRLVQVITNLINNAVKYTPSPGRIWLQAGKEEDATVIRVRDTGIGIEESMLGQIFEMFKQVDNSSSLTKPHGGLGVGLSLAKAIVEMHGGTIQAQSAGLDQGSEFIVRLPLTPQRRSKRAAAEVAPVPPIEAGLRTAHIVARRVLVIDDNVDVAETLGMLLRVMGHEVHLAFSGPLGLKAASSFEPDIIFCDIGMPGMDGYAVASELRKLKNLSRTILVALTGWGKEEDVQLAKKSGFDHHLLKPVHFKTLEKLINEYQLELAR